MDKADYKEKALQQLSDTETYSFLTTDPKFKQTRAIQKTLGRLMSDEILSGLLFKSNAIILWGVSSCNLVTDYIVKPREVLFESLICITVIYHTLRCALAMGCGLLTFF